MARCREGTNTDELAPLHLHCVQFPIVFAGADEWPNRLDVPLSFMFPSARELHK